MTPAFPTGKTLASWWTQLAPWQPQFLWVAHLLVHQVEALVTAFRQHPLDPLSAAVLRAIRSFPGSALGPLNEHLGLGRQVLARALPALQSEGLVAAAGTGWNATPLGERALTQGDYSGPYLERRSFTFVAASTPDRPPHYLALPPAALTPCLPPPDWHFEPAVLQDCLDRPAKWKARFGFPTDIQRIGDHEAAAAGRPTWRQVMLDRAERLTAVLVRAAPESGPERLLGFAFRPDGWHLQAQEPLFALETDWHAVFPGLAEDVPSEEWRHAFRAWAESRGLKGPEIEGCPLVRVGHRLQVVLGPRALDRLRSSRSDALKGLAWLLAGEGRIRPAVQIEVVTAEDKSGRE